MKKLLAILGVAMGACISHAATIINADSDLIMGTAYANHYGKYGDYFAADGKRLDLTTPTIAKGATSGTTTYGAVSVYSTVSRSGTAGSNFGCSDSGGSGWRIRINNGGAANGIKYEKMDAFLVNEGVGSATMNADNDTMEFSGRIQNNSGSMVAQGSDSQWRFALQAGGSWYLTDPVNATAIGYGMSGAANISHSIEATEVSWYAYDPTTKPATNGVVEVGTSATPDFTQVTAAGVHQQLLSNGTAGNHGMKTFTVQGVINGADDVWTATNSVNWVNTDNTTNSGAFYTNQAFDFSNTASHYVSPSLIEGITSGTPIYGASFGDTPRYVTNSVNFGAAFDWGIYPNNNGGARLRLNKPDGGVASGTNVHSGVTSGHNLFMFPLTGFTENDADISLQTWSNQGPGGQNMTDGEIRFVVAKIYNATTNWAISSPLTHAVGTNQYSTVTTITTYQGLDWFNYAPESYGGVAEVGTQVAQPYPGDAILAGFRLSAAGISTNNSQAAVIGGRSFSFVGREWNEYENDNLVVNANPQTDAAGTGENGVQWELGSFGFDENNPILAQNAILGSSNSAQQTNWWNGASVYGALQLDGTYPDPDPSIDYEANTESNFNSAALSVARTSGGDGFKIQWNGDFYPGVGEVAGEDYKNGRYAAGDVATGLFVWKSDEFLGGEAGSTYEMTSLNDVLKANVAFKPQADNVLASGSVRFVIKENDQYYISYANTFTEQADDSEVVRQATATAWFPFDPLTSITAVDTTTNATQATLELTDVQAFGVWMQATVATNTGYRLYPRIGIDSFAAGAIVNTPTAASRKTAWFSEFVAGMGELTGDADDADGDGVKNIIEYAFGGNPTNASNKGNQPTTGVIESGSSNMFEFIYFERSDAAQRGLTTSIKATDNLIFTPFADASSFEVSSGPSEHAGYNAVTNHVPMDSNVKFIRVDVDYAE